MRLQITPILRKALLLFIIPALLFTTAPDLQAKSKKKTSQVKQKSGASKLNKSKSKKKKSKIRKSKRVYNPDKTRTEALELIRAKSTSISELAGLQPMPADSAKKVSLDIQQSESLNEESYDRGEDIAELEAEDDVTVDIETFKTLWLAYMDDGDGGEMTDGGLSKNSMMGIILDWLGTPYRFGGTAGNGIDCSAFTRMVLKESHSIQMPRTAREQVQVGEKISRKNLKFGDLVFFHTYSRKFASHVGIYLGDDLFAHAGSRYGVTVSSLESTYYTKRFIGGRRLSPRDIERLTVSKSKEEN